MTFLEHREVPLVWLRKFGLLARALERMGWYAMDAARPPAGSDCLVLGRGLSGAEQDNPRTVLP